MTANVYGQSPNFLNTAGLASCQLRDNSGGVIGGVESGIPAYTNLNSVGGDGFGGFAVLTFTGGTVNPSGGHVSLWCGGKNLSQIQLASGQLLAMQVGGFI
jgi:hypothetical protein